MHDCKMSPAAAAMHQSILSRSHANMLHLEHIVTFEKGHEMTWNSTVCRVGAFTTLAAAFSFIAAPAAVAQESGAGDPLAMCSSGENAYYVLEWTNTDDGARAALKKIALGDYTAASPAAPVVNELWSGTSPASVAAGMGKDGYLYGVGPYGMDVSVIRYGTAGAEVLGQVVYGDASLGTVGDPITDKYDTKSHGDNYNAADINPVTGHLVVGALMSGRAYSGGTPYLDVLLEIDVTQSPPALVNVMDLSPSIPQTTGDFAISADGRFAYAVTYGAAPDWWTVDLDTGTVTHQAAPAGAAGSYGAAARLPDGNLAFDRKGVAVDVFDAAGNPVQTGLQYNFGGTGFSQDGAMCRVKPTPVPTLSQWGLLLLGLGFGTVALLRRRRFFG